MSSWDLVPAGGSLPLPHEGVGLNEFEGCLDLWPSRDPLGFGQRKLHSGHRPPPAPNTATVVVTQAWQTSGCALGSDSLGLPYFLVGEPQSLCLSNGVTVCGSEGC